MNYWDIEFIGGILNIITVTIGFYIGFLIISKYFTHKRKEFLIFGICAILLFSPWWPGTISFIKFWIMTEPLPDKMYFLIGNVLLPVAVILWLIIVTDFLNVNKKLKKQLFIIFTIYGIIFEIMLFTLLIYFPPEFIGTIDKIMDVQYKNIIRYMLLSLILYLLITGVLFARESIKFDDPEIQLKGKLMLVAFILFSLGAILDTEFPLDYVSLLITRIIMISSVIFFYAGLVLPDSIKNLLLGKKASSDRDLEKKEKKQKRSNALKNFDDINLEEKLAEKFKLSELNKKE